MRTAKYFGKILRFPDDDWEATLDRLDSKNIVMKEANALVHGIIEKECYLCKKYRTFTNHGLCNQCPFSVFGKRAGCVKFLDLLKPSSVQIMSWSPYGISWYKENDYKVRRILKDLRKHLFKMTKI